MFCIQVSISILNFNDFRSHGTNGKLVYIEPHLEQNNWVWGRGGAPGGDKGFIGRVNEAILLVRCTISIRIVLLIQWFPLRVHKAVEMK